MSVPEAHDIRLGDVAVSMPDGRHGGFTRKGFLSAPPVELRGAVFEMKSDHRVHDNRVEEFISAMLQKGSGLIDYRRPPSASDVLFAADYQHVASNNRGTCKHGDPEHIIQRPRRAHSCSRIHYGLIASGDRVMRSAIKRDLEVQNLGDGVLCFEMEAAGLSTEFSYLVIRGISNYADSHKNDAWQHYAAAAAAACTKEVLTYLDPAAPMPSSSHSDDSWAVNGSRGHVNFSGTDVQSLGSFPVGRDFSVGGKR
ncbi:nucleoside phosphorylase domain-containing protein [Xylaria sp. FL1042]|nr:nucleoside phosphorylase domain-containing protein [Xylaria sp. FL1042]